MKKWILSKMLEISAWIGILVVLASLFAPRHWIFSLGLLLIVLHDDTIKNLINKYAPGLSKAISDILDEIEN